MSLRAASREAIKSVVPATVRNRFRTAARRARYQALRGAAAALRPLVGYRAPLIGFEADLIRYARRSSHPVTMLSEPTTISPAHGETFSTPARAVAVIEHGRVAFDYGVVISPEHKLLADVSPQLGAPPELHEALYRWRLPPVTKINASLAVISTTAHQRYFHWMFDALPRIGILRQAGVESAFFLANQALPYQRETVARLGIDPAKIIAPRPDTHIEAERLIVPSLPGTIGYPTPWSIEFLRSNFLGPGEGASGRPHRRLYVSRRDAQTRRILNEQDLVEQLRRRGFEEVILDGVSVADQVELFAKAAIVVGPHGAGFTNAVFCQPGSALVEIIPDSYFNPCFEVLAGLHDLRYRRLSFRADKVTGDQHVNCASLLAAIDEVEG
jgi:capsular polysaccharide biosynthesis protein